VGYFVVDRNGPGLVRYRRKRAHIERKKSGARFEETFRSGVVP